METKENEKKPMSYEPEVVFNALSDRRVLAVMTEDSNETIMEISGYDLQIKFNRDKLKDVADIENMLDGLKDLFRRVVMENLLEKATDDNT